MKRMSMPLKLSVSGALAAAICAGGTTASAQTATTSPPAGVLSTSTTTKKKPTSHASSPSYPQTIRHGKPTSAEPIPSA